MVLVPIGIMAAALAVDQVLPITAQMVAQDPVVVHQLVVVVVAGLTQAVVLVKLLHHKVAIMFRLQVVAVDSIGTPELAPAARVAVLPEVLVVPAEEELPPVAVLVPLAITG